MKLVIIVIIHSLGKSVSQKGTHPLIPFAGLTTKKQNSGTKDSTKGEMGLEVHKHLLITL